MVFRFGPLELEGAAGEMGGHAATGAPRNGAGDADRAGAGAAGEGFARAALPDPHRHIVSAVHLNELDIGAARESRIDLDLWADAKNHLIGDLLDEDYRVWIAHRNTSQ